MTVTFVAQINFFSNIINSIKLIRYVVVRYKTDNDKQSMCNLASLVLGMVSPLQSLPVKRSTLNWLKQAISLTIGFVGIFLDGMIYHNHFKVSNIITKILKLFVPECIAALGKRL
jgi:hypothetical protein